MTSGKTKSVLLLQFGQAIAAPAISCGNSRWVPQVVHGHFARWGSAAMDEIARTLAVKVHALNEQNRDPRYLAVRLKELFKTPM